MPETFIGWVMFTYFTIGAAGGWMVVWYVARDQIEQRRK